MTRKTIDYEQITNELIREIKESFTSKKTGTTHLKTVKIKTTTPENRKKQDWVNILEKKGKDIEINEDNLRLAIRNKKLPGETEEEFKNKILKSLKIDYNQITFTPKGTSSRKRKISGKEWKEYREEQKKLPESETKPIGSVPGGKKNVMKKLSETQAEKEMKKIKSDRMGIMTSIKNAFNKGLNKDFDRLNNVVKRLLNSLSDTEFKNLLYGRSDNFYLTIFSSDEDIIKNSYVELIKDLLTQTNAGRNYINNMKKDNPLYNYLKDLKKIDDLFDDYLNKSLGVRTKPIIIE